jgi:membrane-bound lytic murein transglycosylase D
MKSTKFLLINALLASSFLGLANMAQGEKDSVKNKPIDLSQIVLEDDPFMAHLDSLLVMNFFSNPSLQQNGTEAFALTVPDSLVPKEYDWHDTVYEERLRKLNQATPLNLTYNPTVRAFIDLYAKRRRTQLSQMLGLAAYYFPMFEEKLDQYNMPLELKYLAVVESALNPVARSRVGATGLWQFMYSTGRLQGLEVNSYVDERTDPLKSTEAACKYLTKLHTIFKDWDLALAAYNSGPGNVSKAIRRSGGKKDYWSIRPFLPRETASYVPAFIAVNYIMNHHEDHLIFPTQVKPSFFNVDTVWVKEQLSFAQIRHLIDIQEDELRFLNPSFKSKIIPKSESDPYVLVLPTAKMGLFVSHEDSIYALARKDFEQKEEEKKPVVAANDRVRHRVRRGEVLGTIAERYGVRVSSLRRWNGIRGNTIRVGQYLTVYPKKSPAKQSTQKTAVASKSSGSKNEYVTYRVRSGETFYSIARKYPGISAQNIMSWNNYSNSRSLRPGARLKIYPNRT